MKPLYIKKNGVINKVGGIAMPPTYPSEDVTYDNTSSGLTGDMGTVLLSQAEAIFKAPPLPPPPPVKEQENLPEVHSDSRPSSQ